MKFTVANKYSLVRMIIFFYSLSFINQVSAEIYRWVDAEGKTHISDRAPEEDVENIQTLDDTDIKLNTVSEDENAKKGRENYLKNLSASQQQEQVDADKQAKQQAKINAACKKMKSGLSFLSDGGAIYNTDEKGERVYMSDEVRDKQNAELSSSYNKNCQSYQKGLE